MTPMEPLTPERRRAMTRRYLLDAAAIIFAEKGFQRATLDEVAATAGFSKGAVYSNFASKDDLFLALLEDRMERLYEETSRVIDDAAVVKVSELVAGEPLYQDDAWETLYLEFVLYAQREPDASAKLAALAQRERTLVQTLIERECEAAGVQPVHPPEEVATVVQALFSGLGTTRLVDPAVVTATTVDLALSLVHACMGIGETSEP